MRLNYRSNNKELSIVGVSLLIVSVIWFIYGFHYQLQQFHLRRSRITNQPYAISRLKTVDDIIKYVQSVRTFQLRTLAGYDYSSILNDNRELSQANEVQIFPKRSGIRALSAIINDEHKIIMCTVPKVGSSTWRKFMLHLQFPDLNTTEGKKRYKAIYGQYYGPNRTDPDPHAIAKNGVKLIANLSAAEALHYYQNVSYLKLFHARNPLTRVLSAWLSKNKYSDDPTDFAIHHDNFPAFIKNLSTYSSEFLHQRSDPHIRPQVTFCDKSRGAKYDIILKFEQRESWAPILLKRIGRQGYRVPTMKRTLQALALGSHWNRSSRSAESLETILSHYDSQTLAFVQSMYADDIYELGYNDDVKLLGLAILANDLRNNS